MLTFLFLNQTLWCDHSLESSRRDDFNEAHIIGFSWEMRKLSWKPFCSLFPNCSPANVLFNCKMSITLCSLILKRPSPVVSSKPIHRILTQWRFFFRCIKRKGKSQMIHIYYSFYRFISKLWNVVCIIIDIKTRKITVSFSSWSLSLSSFSQFIATSQNSCIDKCYRWGPENVLQSNLDISKLWGLLLQVQITWSAN